MAKLFMASLGAGQAFDLLTAKGPIRVRGTGRVLVDPGLDPDTDAGLGVLKRIEAYNKGRPGSFIELGEANADRPLLEWIPEPTAGDDQVRLWLASADVDYSRATGPDGLHALVMAEVQRRQKLAAKAEADAAGTEWLLSKAAAADELSASLKEERASRLAAEDDLRREREEAAAERKALIARLDALEAAGKPAPKPPRGKAKAEPAEAKPNDQTALVE